MARMARRPYQHLHGKLQMQEIVSRINNALNIRKNINISYNNFIAALFSTSLSTFRAS